jgi:hypothetical protein
MAENESIDENEHALEWATRFEGGYAALDNRCPRPPGRRLHRERMAPMPLARMGLPPDDGQVSGQLRRRRVRRLSGRTRSQAHRVGPHGGDDGELGRVTRRHKRIGVDK